MNAPVGYSQVVLPNVTGPVLVWRCNDCAGLLQPVAEDAATHDRWHDRVASRSHGRRR